MAKFNVNTPPSRRDDNELEALANATRGRHGHRKRGRNKTFLYRHSEAQHEEMERLRAALGPHVTYTEMFDKAMHALDLYLKGTLPGPGKK
jgi:hypothetical protein